MKNARLVKNQPSAPKNAKHIKLTPRQIRLSRALLNSAGGLSRSAVDRLTPCANGPEAIRQLRMRLGVVIPCESVPFVTIDGTPGRRGVYRPTEEDRQKLTDALKCGGGETCGEI